MPLPPQLDPAQRQAALEKAAAARRQRAELKEKLKAGSISLGELLAQGDTDEKRKARYRLSEEVKTFYRVNRYP